MSSVSTVIKTRNMHTSNLPPKAKPTLLHKFFNVFPAAIVSRGSITVHNLAFPPLCRPSCSAQSPLSTRSASAHERDPHTMQPRHSSCCAAGGRDEPTRRGRKLASDAGSTCALRGSPRHFRHLVTSLRVAEILKARNLDRSDDNHMTATRIVHEGLLRGNYARKLMAVQFNPSGIVKGAFAYGSESFRYKFKHWHVKLLQLSRTASRSQNHIAFKHGQELANANCADGQVLPELNRENVGNKVDFNSKAS
ncbi:hypothetical protein K438DRAFT_1769275 [Mycena galopus ATCC 62051]|nr:hypothetical protein K438DRAFT_1769275 [Mycena galopus ATCC 62051]